MIRKLFEKNKLKKIEKALNKPTYQLKDLYVGEIVYFKNREFTGYGKCDYYYRPIKSFAIFSKIGFKSYIHIKSGQILCDIDSSDALVGDYVVHKIKLFQEVFPIYMRRENMTPTTKVSKTFIDGTEDKINEQKEDSIDKIETLFD